MVAHSYGGIITAEAANGVSSVRHLLLVSSYLPEVGQSLSDFGNGSVAPFLDIDPDSGTFGVRPDFLVDTFLQDCDSDTPIQAAYKLARQSVHVTAQSVGAAAWQQVPSTYLVCVQDRGTPVRLQRDSPARSARSSNSILAITRSCPNLPRFATCCLTCDSLGILVPTLPSKAH